MKYNLKEKKNRKSHYFSEASQIILKSIIRNRHLETTTKLNVTLRFSTITKLSSKVHLVNRCVITGRKNRCNKLYKFSRLIFLKLARNNDILELKKETW